MNAAEIVNRIKSKSTWFIRLGKPGDARAYAADVQQIAADFPNLASVLSKSSPQTLLTDLTTTFGLKRAVELAMLVTGIGGTPLSNLGLYLNFTNKGQKPLVLTSHIQMKSRDLVQQYTLSAFGRGTRVTVDHKNLAKLPNKTLEDVLFILCFGYSTKELGSFLTWRRCDLARHCGKPVEQTQGELMLSLVAGHEQMAGRANVNTGVVAAKKVRDAVDKLVKQSGGWLQIASRVPDSVIPDKGEKKTLKGKGKALDLVLKIEPPLLNLLRTPCYIGIEIAWQETGNSVIHRKDSEYLELGRKLQANGHHFCVVVDGVGYFSREKAMESIAGSAEMVVGLSDDELKLLVRFIEEKLQEYKDSLG